jgi:hypothetical protein
MKPALSPALLALLSIGCAPELIDGVWQFSMQATDQASDACNESISHNFSDAWVPAADADDPAWTQTEDEAKSDQVFYGLITSTGPDAATLIIGTEAYPGVHEADGVWTFTWTSMTTSADSATHASGYAWDSTTDQTREVVFELLLTGDVLDGTETSVVTSTQNWSESDVWNGDELYGYLSGNGYTGQIPSYSYLVTDDDDPKSETLIAQYNTAEAFDCDDPVCALNRLYTCDESWPIDAVRTTLSTGEDYEGVVGAGQQSGY